MSSTSRISEGVYIAGSSNTKSANLLNVDVDFCDCGLFVLLAMLLVLPVVCEEAVPCADDAEVVCLDADEFEGEDGRLSPAAVSFAESEAASPILASCPS